MVTIKDVARLAAVSIGTVSNFLNRPELLAPDTKRRVLNAITELGYVRNESARSLRAGRSRIVAVVVPDPTNPFFTDIARGAAEVINAHGALLVLCGSGDIARRERAHLQLLEERRAAGVLITPVDADNPWLIDYARRGTPLVLLDRPPTGGRHCSVAVNDVSGGWLAVGHLATQGHRSLVFIGGPSSTPRVRDRLDGAMRAAGEAGIELRVIETDELSMNAGRLAAKDLLGRRRHATGVICVDDLIALGVMAELREQGLRIPEDIAIIGHDDIAYSVIAATPLSSVRQPRQMMGRTAAELLFDELSQGNQHNHRRVVFDPELVVRASSGGKRTITRKSTQHSTSRQRSSMSG